MRYWWMLMNGWMRWLDMMDRAKDLMAGDLNWSTCGADQLNPLCKESTKHGWCWWSRWGKIWCWFDSLFCKTPTGPFSLEEWFKNHSFHPHPFNGHKNQNYWPHLFSKYSFRYSSLGSTKFLTKIHSLLIAILRSLYIGVLSPSQTVVLLSLEWMIGRGEEP